MKIYGLVQDSIVDGPGLRFSCFVQGCVHNCPGCHNPDSHDMNAGIEMSVNDVIKEMLRSPITDGLTLTGGEPFIQAEDCLTLAKTAHANGMNVWAYSGWTFEYILNNGTNAQKELLKEVDVLVDGPFILAERSLSLNWKGSRNQRVIDVQASLVNNEIVLFCD